MVEAKVNASGYLLLVNRLQKQIAEKVAFLKWHFNLFTDFKKLKSDFTILMITLW